MNGRKTVSAIRILGLVFAPLGSLFLCLGICLLFVLRETEAWMVGIPFTAVGGIFFALGVVFLSIDGKHRRNAARLMENGRYVWGEVTALEPNTMIRINNRYPYYAVIRYQDPFGKVTEFRSRSSMALRRREDLTGRKVKVYIEDETCRNYTVDIDSLLR